MGCIGIVDGDTVEVSNLHRQTTHAMGYIGKYKVDSVADQIKQRNPLVKVNAYNEHLSTSNVISLFKEYENGGIGDRLA